jgi:hypothetical protein
MNQNDDADARDHTTTEDPTSATKERGAPVLEVLQDPESGRVTFAVQEYETDQKLTEWITIDPEHVVHPEEMQ